MENSNLYLDVSIPSMHENNPLSVFYSPTAPMIAETFEAIKELSDYGKHIRVKIEPIIPSVGKLQGQSEKEIYEIVRNSKHVGAKTIISKTLRLNEFVPDFLRDELSKYFNNNGEKEGYGGRTNLVLKAGLREQLLQPVYDACKRYDIPFCACVDRDVFKKNTTVDCNLR